MIGSALVSYNTRAVWVAAVIAGFYLLWEWRDGRSVAYWHPPPHSARGPPITPARKFDLPSRGANGFQRLSQDRVANRMEMIKAHPSSGLGPEEIGKQNNFRLYARRTFP